ncbi:MAG TPA: enoyl-CoA hydratase/isomerase family protein [Acidimicrobiales bacterium]|nr:enoyl-CoA hydratase/isomerase family protein [Acidimicrobiales bacterium]
MLGSAHDRQGYAPRIVPPPEVLSASSARDLLGAARRGAREVLGTLDGAPMLVVGLGRSDDLPLEVPARLPCVVVAMSRRPPRGPAPPGADLALCPSSAGETPPGWVAVPDVDDEVGRLARQVDAQPHAAVVLAQLLRTSAGLEPGAALVAESLAYSVLQSGPAFARWLAERRRTAPADRVEVGDTVLVARAGNRLRLTLHRPHVRNALNGVMRDALAEALSMVATDPSLEGLDLHGSGPDFSSGGDLGEFGSLPDPATAHLVRTARSPAGLLATVADRVTVHLHGACVGAGIELAAFAGRVVAAPDTRVQLPEVGLGLVPGSGGTVSIPRRVGRHRTAWLAIGGAVLDVVVAARWGLVDAVADG